MLRVLLVEDDPAALALLEAYFRGVEDMAVCGCARNGREALAEIRSQAPDLVVLDMVMPELSGLGVLKALQTAPPPVPPKILILSRVSDEGVIARSFLLGADYYLLKPINLAELPEVIGALFLPEGADRGPACALLDRMGARREDAGYLPAAMAAQALAGAGRMYLKEAYFVPVQTLGTSYACVEKNIRALVRRLHQTGAPLYRSMMGDPGRAPTNGAFLARMAEALRRGRG